MRDIGPHDTFIARKIVISSWEKWFAWRPIKMQHKKVWLKYVYRRSFISYFDLDNHVHYEYGTLIDVLRNTK